MQIKITIETEDKKVEGQVEDSDSKKLRTKMNRLYRELKKKV